MKGIKNITPIQFLPLLLEEPDEHIIPQKEKSSAEGLSKNMDDETKLKMTIRKYYFDKVKTIYKKQ